MSQTSKIRKANREAKQERQGKNVVTWIFAALVVLAIIYAVAVTLSM